MTNNNKYYVYTHHAVDVDGITQETPFYIGMGKGNRLDSDGRNKAWEEVVLQGGFQAFKVAENLTEEEALNMEADLIEEWDAKCDTIINWWIGDAYRGTARGLTKYGTLCKTIGFSGKNHPFFGKKREDHTKWCIENDQGLVLGKGRRPVIVDGIDYRSVNSAARANNVSPTQVTRNCRSKKAKYSEWNYMD